MSGRRLNQSYRCEDGRRFRHDPQHDDPYLETDIGQCPDCEGKGCKCSKCDGIGTICLACDLPIDECECFENSEPCPCDHCGPTVKEGA